MALVPSSSSGEMSAITVIALALVVWSEGVGAEIDLRYVDESADPCDNFYQYACGNFKKYHQRPEGRQAVDLFTITEEELIEKGRTILAAGNGAADPAALRKARAAYRACVESLGGARDEYWYYQNEKELIDSLLRTKNDRISLGQVGEFSAKFGIHHFFEFYVRNFSPSDYVFLVFPDSREQPEMIRPNTRKTYDEVIEESFKRIRNRGRKLKTSDPFDAFFDKVIEYVAPFIIGTYTGTNLTEEIKDNVTRFSDRLFTGGLLDDGMQTPDDITTLGILQGWSDRTFGDEIEINWVEYFHTILRWSGIDINEDFFIYIPDTYAVYGILNLIRQTDPLTVKLFILVRTIMYMAPDSGSELREAFKEYSTSVGLEYYEKEEYCTRKILDIDGTATLSFAVAYDFVNYHFNINKIRRAVEVIHDVTESFRRAVEASEWVDPRSRDSVTRKLDNIEIFLAQPELAETGNSLDEFYENLEICKWDHYGNARRLRAFRQAYTFTEFYNYRNFSGKSAFEVNAYALRASIRIILPLPMIHSSYLDGADDVFDYSRFGSIVAHEFIHHFDDGGVVYDQDGFQTHDLLSASALAAFRNKTQCLVDQYGRYYVDEIGAHLDGRRTLNENLADNGGLRHAWAAFRRARARTPAGALSPEKLFFINFATTYCSDSSVEYLEKLVTSKEHAPPRFRVVGTLSNMEEFSRVFRCKRGSRMNPENKCVIW